MRILIKLEPITKYQDIFPYYTQAQGLIYNFLKESEFQKIHNNHFYKFFCFSNFFLRNRLVNLIISSPNQNFLKVISKQLIEKEYITFNHQRFKLKEVKFINQKIIFPVKIISISPIITRIPKEKYQEYGISSKTSYPSLYWRPEYPLEAFIRQLEANIFKKYKEYYQKEIEEFPIFQKFLFKKSVSIPLELHHQKVNFIGSLWEFHFDFLDEKTKEILEFAIDCGFGEKNSMGFGFVNLEKKLK